ncbi:hypothetical protein AB0B28_05195 [Glycomyces sp. NPDC046736]|uniref:hypothetical protein n=1 Tax=Glycomyces sp. NPDC046736 TaxID=3155615 RepID=UPI00340E7C81
MTDDLFAADDDAGSAAEGGFVFEASLELPQFEFTLAFGDTQATGTDRAGCSSGDCPHPAAHPAEADWVQLASAVPVEGQLHRFKPRCEGMAYPTEEDFRAAVAAVRPADADAFSLQRLRSGWTDEVGGRIGSWPERLKSKLAALAEGWAGEDFDAFAAMADQARALAEGAIDDIESTVAELEQRESAIYTLQGGDSGEIPYPAPMVGTEGEWSNLKALHVRPAWWHGDCITMTCEEAEKALELAGADAGLAGEVREFVEEKVGAGLLGLGTLVSEVRALASEEAKTVFGERVAAELAAYVERQAAIDESIAEKRTGQSAELAAVQTTGEDRPFPSGADVSYMDLAAPEPEFPSPPVSPQTTMDPSPVPPGGDGTAAATEKTEDEADENPWDDDEDDGSQTGGLASGGGYGTVPGGGGSLGAGGGGGRLGGAVGPGAMATPQGLFGPAVTPTPTSGTNAASGSRGGLFGPQGQPGAKGGKAPAKDEEETEAKAPENLARRETDNVWGWVAPKDDPHN